MRKIILAGVIALALVGCTRSEKQTAAAVIDAACDNLSILDVTWAAIAPNANRSAQLAYSSAKASLQAICDNRPLKKPEQQIAAATAAVTKITALIAQYRGSR